MLGRQRPAAAVDAWDLLAALRCAQRNSAGLAAGGPLGNGQHDGIDALALVGTHQCAFL